MLFGFEVFNKKNDNIGVGVSLIIMGEEFLVDVNGGGRRWMKLR